MKLRDHYRNLAAAIENEIELMDKDSHFEDLMVRCSTDLMEEGVKKLRGIVDILKET
jgi:hypothetical protein